jgi:coproporphyrinogen III oxidase-like Fe-S oxidoreductase
MYSVSLSLPFCQGMRIFCNFPKIFPEKFWRLDFLQYLCIRFRAEKACRHKKESSLNGLHGGREVVQEAQRAPRLR